MPSEGETSARQTVFIAEFRHGCGFGCLSQLFASMFFPYPKEALEAQLSIHVCTALVRMLAT